MRMTISRPTILSTGFAIPAVPSTHPRSIDWLAGRARQAFAGVAAASWWRSVCQYANAYQATVLETAVQDPANVHLLYPRV